MNLFEKYIVIKHHVIVQTMSFEKEIPLTGISGRKNIASIPSQAKASGHRPVELAHRGALPRDLQRPVAGLGRRHHREQSAAPPRTVGGSRQHHRARSAAVGGTATTAPTRAVGSTTARNRQHHHSQTAAVGSTTTRCWRQSAAPPRAWAAGRDQTRHARACHGRSRTYGFRT